MAKIYSAFRLSPEVVQAIEEHSLEAGIDKTAVVEQALRQAFGFPDEPSGVLLDSSILQRLTTLENFLYNDVLQRLTTLEASLEVNLSKKLLSSDELDLEPCSARALALRLGFRSHDPVTDRKNKPEFSEWSASKDPEGLAWKYHKDGKFYPSSTVTTLEK